MVFKENSNNIELQKNNSTLEKNRTELNKCINELVLGNEFKGDIYNKSDLYNSIQEEWFQWAQNHDLAEFKAKEENIVDYLNNISSKIKKFRAGFASTPKMYNSLIPKEHPGRGLDCTASSMIAASVLEKQNINFSFVNPVGHTALIVKDLENEFYFDPSNGITENLAGKVKEVEKYGQWDLIKLKDEIASRYYSYLVKNNEKENIVRSVIGNILVLADINEGNLSGASKNIGKHKETAIVLSPIITGVNVNLLSKYYNDMFPDFYKGREYFRTNEEKRLEEIGFYD